MSTAPGSVITCATADEAAAVAAGLLADALTAAVDLRGRASLAVSGGRTPAPMLRQLAGLPVPFDVVELFQVDERQAAAGSADRNAASLSPLLEAIPETQAHLMPIDADLDASAAAYAATLRRVVGDPVILDAVHLGLGDDGHTASLVPGDPARMRRDVPVTATGEYRGHRRVTLTAPVLAAARTCVILATGADKSRAVAALLTAAPESVAATVIGPRSTLVVDRAALSSAAPG
jgi:6-phosphogluconolactonase